MATTGSSMFGIMMDTTLPDDIRNEIITSALKKNIASGNSDHLLDVTSPRTKRLKERFEFIMLNCSIDDQQSLLTKVTQDWLSQRSINNSSTSSRPPKSTMPPTPGAQTTIPQQPPVSTPQSLPSLHTTKPARKWTHENTQQTTFSSLALALDHLGPAVLVVRCNVKCDNVVHPSWTNKEYKCTKCSCCWLVSSPQEHLGSSPTFVFCWNAEAHMQHMPITWEHHYQMLSTNKNSDIRCSTKSHPGLPNFLHLAINNILQVNPSAQPLKTWSDIEQQFRQHPLFLDNPTARAIIKTQVITKVRNYKKKKNN
jgi:hypothetical protein